MDYKEYGKKMLNYFLQGLVVIAPIAITIYAIISLFSAIDNILPNIIHAIFPNWIHKNEMTGEVDKVPGLGFITVIGLVLVVGWLSSKILIGRFVDFFNKVLEKTPGIKLIYGSVKDFFEAFAGKKKKFDKPVLVCVDDNDIWRIGFITHPTAEDFDMKDYVVVYVPMSYAISGITYIVPPQRIKPLQNISASDAMKFAVSGGVVDVEE